MTDYYVNSLPSLDRPTHVFLFKEQPIAIGVLIPHTASGLSLAERDGTGCLLFLTVSVAAAGILPDYVCEMKLRIVDNLSPVLTSLSGLKLQGS